MKRYHPLLLILFCTTFLTTHAQDFQIHKDLSSEWKVFINNKYEKFEGNNESVNAIYFHVEADKYEGEFLEIKGREPFTVFINDQLATSGKQVWLSADSLANVFSTSLLTVCIYQKEIQTTSLTTVVKKLSTKVEEREILPRKSSSFRDFVIVAFLLLIMLAIVIVRLHPKLASDYFSVTKIFSLRELDESHAYSRIASSTNILFYVFCSLMLSYYLMIIFHFVHAHYPSATLFHAENFHEAFANWLQLSLILFAVFFLKLVLVYGLTFLFGVKEVAGVHYFNWMRFMLVVFGVLTMVLSVYFIMRGQQVIIFSIGLQLLAWVMAMWMILIYLKLSGRMGQSLFHLFSYICATEIIPFLITLKVLYN